MIIISDEKSVTGLAGTTGVIAYSLMGTKFTNYGEKPFTLAQGILTDAAAELYAPEITETAKIQTIILTNTSSSAVTGVKVLVDDTQISPALVIPANGCAVFDGTGWKISNTTSIGRSYVWIYNATGAVEVGLCGRVSATPGGRWAVVSDSTGRSTISYVRLP